jgi:hypothetical protein
MLNFYVLHFICYAELRYSQTSTAKGCTVSCLLLCLSFLTCILFNICSSSRTGDEPEEEENEGDVISSTDARTPTIVRFVGDLCANNNDYCRQELLVQESDNQAKQVMLVLNMIHRHRCVYYSIILYMCALLNSFRHQNAHVLIVVLRQMHERRRHNNVNSVAHISMVTILVHYLHK